MISPSLTDLISCLTDLDRDHLSRHSVVGAQARSERAADVHSSLAAPSTTPLAIVQVAHRQITTAIVVCFTNSTLY